MGISYRPLFVILASKGLKKQISWSWSGFHRVRLQGSQKVNLFPWYVIDKICAALECQPGDILEYVKEEKSKKKQLCKSQFW